MGKSIDELIELLKPDPWRTANPFNRDIAECHEVLFDLGTSRAQKADVLNDWLKSRQQPCLFGRMAANQGWLEYCILTDNDVARGDDHVREVIHDAREVWQEQARTGNKHGFLVVIVSKVLAYAEPNDDLLAFAQKLSDLYLSRSEINEILLDDVALKIDGDATSPAELRAWKVGVNWFGAQGDGRWWRDHRIPGGVGFSMNSVGHMARKLAEAAIGKNRNLAERVASVPREHLVTWALPLAMRTILTASVGPVPGTRLRERRNTKLPDGLSEEERTKMLGTKLCPYSEDEYLGWYNTDTTIPSEYFDPNSKRSREEELSLPFTYLHRESDDAYLSMGLGEPVQEALGLTGFGDADPLE